MIILIRRLFNPFLLIKSILKKKKTLESSSYHSQKSENYFPEIENKKQKQAEALRPQDLRQHFGVQGELTHTITANYTFLLLDKSIQILYM